MIDKSKEISTTGKMWQEHAEWIAKKEGIKGDAKCTGRLYDWNIWNGSPAEASVIMEKLIRLKITTQIFRKIPAERQTYPADICLSWMHIMTKSQNSRQRKSSRSCLKIRSLPIRTPSCLQRRRIMYRLSRTVSIPRIIIRPTMVRRSTTPIWWIWIPLVRYLMLNEFYWNTETMKKEYLHVQKTSAESSLSDRYGIWTGPPTARSVPERPAITGHGWS